MLLKGKVKVSLFFIVGFSVRFEPLLMVRELFKPIEILGLPGLHFQNQSPKVNEYAATFVEGVYIWGGNEVLRRTDVVSH